MFGSLSRAATGDILDWSNATLFFFGLILVIGLIGESKTEPKRTCKQRIWYRRFEFMVIIGVAGELIADGGIFFSSRQLQSISDQELTQANERIIALSPRYWLLTSDVDRRITAALKPFPRQKVALCLHKWQKLRDSEIGFFQMGIAMVLDDSGWLNPWGQRIMKPEPNDPTSKSCTVCLEDSSNAFQSGIWIKVDSAASTSTRDAARALENVLKSAHFTVGLSEGSAPVLPPNPNVILILVGSRPL